MFIFDNFKINFPKHIKIPLMNRPFLLLHLIFILVGSVVLMLVPKGEEVLWVNQHHQPILDTFFYWATMIGDGWMYALVAMALLFVRVGYGVLTIVCFAATGLTVQLFKKIVFADMVRPKVFLEGFDLHFVEGVKMLSQHSFPSGHSATAFSLFFLLSVLVKNKNWGFAFALTAVAAGFSRIYLAQHFLADVIVGSVVGVAITMLVLIIWNRNNLMEHPLINKKLLA